MEEGFEGSAGRGGNGGNTEPTTSRTLVTVSTHGVTLDLKGFLKKRGGSYWIIIKSSSLSLSVRPTSESRELSRRHLRSHSVLVIHTPCRMPIKYLRVR